MFGNGWGWADTGEWANNGRDMTTTVSQSDGWEVAADAAGELIITERVEVAVVMTEVGAPRTSWRMALLRGLGRGLEWIFGCVCLILGLSLLAALPGVQFFSLGYLLEASARVARTGKLSAGLIGVRTAARLGGAVLGIWLVLLPLRFAASMEQSAALIDAESQVTKNWNLVAVGLLVVTVAHLGVACLRGGRLRHFLLPRMNPRKYVRRLRRGGFYARSVDRLWEFLVGLRLWHYGWLGLRGYVGGLAWLFVPVALLSQGGTHSLLGWLGAILLVLVVPLVPFLQTELALQNRLRAMFAPRAVREVLRRGPLVCGLALVATVVLALPLYLLKIETIPREAVWLPSLVFVMFMLPARLLVGWAYGAAGRRTARRAWWWRWPIRLAIVPLVAIYVLVVWFVQFTAWNGIASLFEQHAFLLPVPFLGM